MLDNTPFSYDRRHPPLFFTHSKDMKEYKEIQKMVRNDSKEYFRLASYPNTTHLTVMSNGMTLGEYAMKIIVDRNQKRKN